MRLFALLITFLVGLSAATPVHWEPSKEYRFKYSGRHLNGLPELSNQFSGLGVNATICLKVKTPNQFYLTVEDAKFVAVNQQLQTQERVSQDEGNNWRQLRLPEMSPVPQDKAAYLKLPLTFTMGESGAFQDLKVEKKDTLWSMNFKKAMANLLQVKMQTRHLQNMIESPTSEDHPFWTVKEQSILGQCETTYKVNKLPQYVVRQSPSLLSNPNACHGQEYFEIVRTMNLDKCDRFAALQFFGGGEFSRCSADTMTNCDNFWGRSSSVRIIACGSSSSGKLTLQTIISDGEMNTILLGHKTENFVTGTRQNLTLTEVRSASSYPDLREPKQLDSLLYEFATNPSNVEPLKGDDTPLRRKGRVPHSSESISESYPSNFWSGLSKDKREKASKEFADKIVDILLDVAKDIHGTSGSRLSESQMGMKLLTAARGFTALQTSDEILRLYGTLQGSGDDIKQSARQLFLDACAMSGTPQVNEFFQKAYQGGHIGEREMTHFLFWLPHNVYTPTENVLKGIFNTITSDAIKSKPGMYNIAITGFSQLVQQACVSPQGLMQYPTWVFGEFCNPESSIVQEVLIPYLSKESRKSGASENHKNIHIVSLGLLSHKNVIGELTPLIENSKGQDAELTRILALYSLANVGRSDPNLVFPIFQTLLANPAESTEVRIVAFNSLLRLNPPTQVFNTIAHLTHQEPSMNYELLKTINVALYTLGHSIKTTIMPAAHLELMQKCRDAYALIKKTYGITPSSANYYKTEFLKDFEVGYQGTFSWIASQESILPKNLFMRFKLFMETASMDAFEFGSRVVGVESLYEKVSEDLSGYSGSFTQKIREGLSSEWKKVIDKLKLETRESSKFNAAFHLRTFDSGILLMSFTESATNSIKDKIVEWIRNPPSSSVNGENKINIQKSFIMNPYMMLVPSEMGFPINMEVYTPTTISLIGKVNPNTDKSNPSLSVDTKMMLSSHITGWVGTIVPFSEQYALTGLDQHVFYNLPGSMKLDVSIPEQKVSMNIRPGYESRSGEIDLFHYHVKPYTVVERIDSLVPHTKSQGMKVIRSSSPQKTGEYKFGQNLGFSLNTKYKTESAFTDTRSLLQIIRMFNYSPLNMAFFQYAVPSFDNQMRPSIRHHKCTVTINPSESFTKEIHMEFKLGCATRHESKEAKYHSLETVSQSQRLSASESAKAPSISSFVKKVLPYRVKTQSLESVSQHQGRAEKIKKSFEDLGMTESAYGFSVITNIVLKGNRPKTYTYSFAFAKGRQSQETKRVEQKWNLHLESGDNSESWMPKKICLNGKLDFPLLPIWNVNRLRTSLAEFYYQNNLSFGWKKCSESFISTKGVARVSSKQRSYSRETPENRKCQKMTHESVKGSELSEACQQARDQASALDEIEFTTEFKNVPKLVSVAEQRAVGLLKAYWWPYYNFKASHGSESFSQSYQTRTLIAFKQNTPSFDLTITRPQEVVTFANIHVLEPYSLFFPLKAGMSTYSTLRKVSGNAVYPSCKVDATTITSFDNKTIPFKSDKCFHLLTADCSKYKRFGVSVRNFQDDKMEVKVYLKDTVVFMTPSENGQPKVTVDGQPTEVRPNHETQIQSHGKCVATVTASVDGVVILRAPSLYLEELACNGKLISVVSSPMMKSKLCGLCGDCNNDKNGDISSPQKCVFSKPELKVASYRIPSESCPSMRSELKNELWKETEQCSKYKIQPTKVAQGFKINTGKCTLLRHIIMQQSKEVCISKVPVTQCGPSCKASRSELVEKTVDFVCMPKGRVADLYIKKVHEGQTLDELKNMDTAYKLKIQQPRHCVHALVSGSSPSF